MLLDFLPAADLVLKRDVAHAEDRTDGQDFGAAYPLVIDVRAIGGIEVEHAQLVGGELHRAMLARNAWLRNDDVRRLRAADL